MALSLQGKVALVTGAAGGIGDAICQALAARGVRIIAGYNSSSERARHLCEQLPGQGHIAMHAPVLDSAALKTLSDNLSRDIGHLDILVNNAGMTQVVAHDDLDGLGDDVIDQIFATNVRGAFACVRAFRPLLQESGDGLVVNISSIAGTTAVGSNVAYCASKAAVNSMTMSLARALAPDIRVVAVAPGWVDGDYARRADPVYLQQQIDHTPLKRIAQAQDVADAVVALASTMTFNTGCVIPVDGGRPLM
ncbi:SDR family oxidoreductase [Pseudomaricurvus alkylphenolicus]|uniref:SDR family NAD(P)-dependent oxidoreductase n=1 Tax=Pseudomaricurvus alkylphenolicus TaxID=1306991 RepID=UPI0014210551|nr:SDR family oxidoreductase [Pseudomaricurvus alkylphenolicus]NIB38227.1 SDR family oxidoreductase [Pseudomaricurvus alkylphenolicus]